MYMLSTESIVLESLYNFSIYCDTCHYTPGKVILATDDDNHSVVFCIKLNKTTPEVAKAFVSEYYITLFFYFLYISLPMLVLCTFCILSLSLYNVNNCKTIVLDHYFPLWICLSVDVVNNSLAAAASFVWVWSIVIYYSFET